MSENTAAYICTQRYAATLQKTFFRRILNAPAGYISLGLEIDRISRALEYLVFEIQNPDSEVVHRGNVRATRECLGIVLGGAHNTLVEIERTLVGMQVRCHSTERWIDFFATRRYRRSEEWLRELEQRVGFHCWAFGLVMRTLMMNDAKGFLASIQTMAVTAHLGRVLYQHVEQLDKGQIFRQLNERCTYRGRYLFSDFRTDAVIRVVMFWTFRAISKLSRVVERRHVCPTGYLDLLKAAWLFLNMQDVQRISPSSNEMRAALALVSTELLFTFKQIEKVGHFPSRDTIMRHGDFRVFPGHLGEQQVAASTVFEADGRHSLQVEILDKLSEIPARMSKSANTSSKPFQGLSEPGDVLLSQPPPLTACATVQRTPGRKSKRHTLSTLRVDIQKDGNHRESLIVKPLWHYTTSPNSVVPIRHKPRTVPPSLDAWTLNPIPSANIDDIYCDSPTLGFEEIPIKIEPWIPASIVPTPTTDTSAFLLPVLPDLLPRQPKRPERSLRSRLAQGSFTSSAGPAPPLTENPQAHISSQLSRSTTLRASVIRIRDARTPSPTVDDQDWDVAFAIEYGVKPGEREIMPESFSPMRLKAAETCNLSTHWEDCRIRLFENQATGEYRILTLRGKNVDERTMRIASTELVPHYAFDGNPPVIYLRETTPARSFSKKKGYKPNRKSILIQPNPPTTLYYRFHNLFDIFTFQQSLLRETVLADLQNLPTIHYTRNRTHSTHYARIQVWKATTAPPPSRTATTTTTLRRSALPEAASITTTRLILYLNDTKTIITLLITDDLMLQSTTPRTLQIKPSSYRTFNNPSFVRARILGSGFRLGKDRYGIESQDCFEDLKSLEIEFRSEEEAGWVREDIQEALQRRRREKLVVEELKKTERGAKVWEWVG